MPPTAPAAHAPLLLAASSPSGGAGSGWLYDLLRKAGVSPSTAHTVVEFVLRPFWIIVVVGVAVLVAHFGARAIRRWLGRLTQHAASRSTSPRAAARAATVSALVANLWRAFVAAVAAAVILGMLGINLTPLLASATIIGATIGFGAQALIRDYLSGALLTIEDQFGIGDAITVNGTSGVVEDLSLRVTRIRAADGTLWHVPNGDIRKLGNSSRGWAKAMVELPLSPAPRGPHTIATVEQGAREAALAVARRPEFAPLCPEPPEVVGVVAADATSYTLRIMLRTQPQQRDALERALRGAVVDRLLHDGLWPGPPSANPGDTASPGPGAQPDGQTA